METNVNNKYKAFTSLEQSKKLAQILPLESADMYYWCADHYPKEDWIIEVGSPDDNYECICAWSLAALLGVLPEKYTELIKEGGMYRIIIKDSYMTCLFDNPVDACVSMIEQINKLNLL